MGVIQRQVLSIMRQHGLAVQYLEPGKAFRRNRQASHTPKAQASGGRANAGSRYAFLREHALAGSIVSHRLVLSLKIVAMAPPET